MNLNKLTEPVDDIHNYIFYAVRNGKASAIRSFIENYFLKKGFNVTCLIDPRSITVRLQNDKKKGWEYSDSYIWLEDMRKKYRFSDSYSNFCFQVKSTSVKQHFSGRTPKMVEEFWKELEELIESGIIHKEVLELNFPFSLNKSPEFDQETLRKRKDENLEIFFDSGNINAKSNVLYTIENIFLRNGFEVEAYLKDGYIDLTFINTKKGQWKTSDVKINFETKTEDPTWNPLISYTYRSIGEIEQVIPKKITKHHESFNEFLKDEETIELIQNALDLLDYPFRNKSYLGC